MRVHTADETCERCEHFYVLLTSSYRGPEMPEIPEMILPGDRVKTVVGLIQPLVASQLQGWPGKDQSKMAVSGP